MSYNLTSTQVHKIKNLRVKVRLLEDLGFEPYDKGYYHEDSEDFTLQGKVQGEELVITGIELYGEGSRNSHDLLSKKVFPKTTGKLVLLEIWSGVEVNITVVNEGEVTESDISKIIEGAFDFG